MQHFLILLPSVSISLLPYSKALSSVAMIVLPLSADFLFCHGIADWCCSYKFVFHKLVVFSLINRYIASRKRGASLFGSTFFINMLNMLSILSKCLPMLFKNSSNIFHYVGDSFFFCFEPRISLYSSCFSFSISILEASKNFMTILIILLAVKKYLAKVF